MSFDFSPIYDLKENLVLVTADQIPLKKYEPLVYINNN